MGLFSAIGGLFGGGAQKKAAQKATDAMVSAYNRGIDTQNQFQQQTRQDYMPYTTAGANAITELNDLIMLGSGGRGLVATPGQEAGSAALASRFGNPGHVRQ